MSLLSAQRTSSRRSSSSRPTLPSYHPYTLQALEQLMFSEPGLHTLVLMDLRMNVMDGTYY